MPSATSATQPNSKPTGPLNLSLSSTTPAPTLTRSQTRLTTNSAIDPHLTIRKRNTQLFSSNLPWAIMKGNSRRKAPRSHLRKTGSKVLSAAIWMCHRIWSKVYWPDKMTMWTQVANSWKTSSHLMKTLEALQRIDRRMDQMVKVCRHLEISVEDITMGLHLRIWAAPRGSKTTYRCRTMTFHSLQPSAILMTLWCEKLGIARSETVQSTNRLIRYGTTSVCHLASLARSIRTI